ncbi:hypothetical protein TDB9533_00971 [Thalassocella blandensis]|nr:hypothetical protein TDB9533_00971 [Thalassocella blandensis]
MLLKKTLGFRISFIAFGAVLSACNAYLSGSSTTNPGEAGYGEFISTAAVSAKQNTAELNEHSTLSLTVNTP